MKPISIRSTGIAALLAFAALGTVANAATTTTTSTTVTSTTTHAQMHTTNNLKRYSKATTQHLSRYQRNECIRRGGVIIKQKSNGQLVCVAKRR
jgi:ABC-type glycerol-3-phosphate transport system substrate-binding protein